MLSKSSAFANSKFVICSFSWVGWFDINEQTYNTKIGNITEIINAIWCLNLIETPLKENVSEFIKIF